MQNCPQKIRSIFSKTSCCSSVAKTDSFLYFKGGLLGLEDVNLVMAAYTPRSVLCTCCNIVQVLFFIAFSALFNALLHSIRSCCYACGLRASCIFAFKLRCWSMRDHVEFRIQGLLRFLAKPIVLSAKSVHVNTIV